MSPNDQVETKELKQKQSKNQLKPQGTKIRNIPG